MKLLLGTILLVASFGAMAACSATSPGDCSDKSACEALTPAGQEAKLAVWKNGSCSAVAGTQKQAEDCGAIQDVSRNQPVDKRDAPKDGKDGASTVIGK